jgi:hypothetical protein
MQAELFGVRSQHLNSKGNWFVVNLTTFYAAEISVAGGRLVAAINYFCLRVYVNDLMLSAWKN